MALKYGRTRLTDKEMVSADATPLHLVTQYGQPYGSERRCCERCGAMCWVDKPGSAMRWSDDAGEYAAAANTCAMVKP